MTLLRLDGTVVLVGLPSGAPRTQVFPLADKRWRRAGFYIGGMADTQEIPGFCAAHNIVADVEMILGGLHQRGPRASGEKRREVPSSSAWPRSK